MDNEIELMVKVDQSPDEVEKFKAEILAEQHKRYLALQNELDEQERIVGSWNPANKINNIYEAMDQVHDEIDEFNVNEDSTKVAPTPTGS